MFGTRKEKFYYYNTLLCLVKTLLNKNITVDLRNDSYVCGRLDNIDGFMNLSFEKVVYCDTIGNEFYFDNLYLQARNIRYVHIPETINIINTINQELKSNIPQRVINKPITQSRKVKKALRQHLETVASLGSSGEKN